MMRTRSRINPRLGWIVEAVVVLGLAAIAAPSASAEDLHRGTWTEKSFAIAGSWSIEKNADGHVLILDEAFKTKKAPDLKLFLSKQPLADTDGKNATRDAVLIAPLKSHKGGQRFSIPAGVDLSDYRTLLLHCEKYSKLWGGAPLG